MTGVLLAGLVLAGGRAEALDAMKTDQVVVTAQTNLLHDYRKPDSIAGSIAGIQVVKLACEPQEWDCGKKSGGKEYIPVQTWLGKKWIEDDARVVYGSYEELDREITLDSDTMLYDRPVGSGFYAPSELPPGTGQSLAPQKIRVTGAVHYMHKWVRSGRGMLEGSGTWYRVPTSWMGDRWILDPFIPEDIKELPTDTLLQLSGDEPLYDYPHAAAGRGEQAPAGVVQPVAFSIFTVKTEIVIWYKFQRADGSLKWVQIENTSHAKQREFKLDHQQVNIHTAVRLFDSPGVPGAEPQLWLQPGSYAADEVDNGWVHIETPEGWKWVNLDRAFLERPIGIKATTETVRLGPETQAYSFPLSGEVSHRQGSFSEQTAQAFEKWTSPQGVDWYHIPSFSGTVWVPEKPLPE
ncbi:MULTISPECIES: hypothetical protein [Paenibacillus]|uniref:hypothetical protein n=1 Tax=Paenibacillus TaxID=44249 RepID=UPI0022B8AE67|nr:hypothetical protein [Paenibacillus caseinilyticus]MCZ8521784.1 hypothetical protein [Paenibacillus caseinilyticus]